MDGGVSRRAGSVLLAMCFMILIGAPQVAQAVPAACTEIELETEASTESEESEESEEAQESSTQSQAVEDPCLYVESPQPTGSDPTWNAMPAAARAAFAFHHSTIMATKPVAVGGIIAPPVSGGLAELYTVRCWEGFHIGVEGKASGGNTLWTYHQEIDWCENGTRIKRKLHRIRWGETSTPGWHFRGHIANNKSGGIGSTSAYRRTQGKFELCWAWCVQEAHPWIEMTVYGNGSYSCNTSAGRPSIC
jgi:hypothetical protein